MSDEKARSSEYSIREFTHGQDESPADTERLREQYGRVRAHFKIRPRKYRDLQKSLNSAHYGISYDVYLTRSVWYALGAAAVGAVLSIAVTWMLVESGFVAGIQNPLEYRSGLTVYLGQNRTLFSGIIAALALSAVFAAATWLYRYNSPRLAAGRRQRNIDITLPHAITFMYALSRGGMDLLEVMRTLAENEATYGEIATECELVVREIEFFGNDLDTALRNRRALSPSENFAKFLDDMVGVMDSGGDLPTFFENEADKYLEDARDEQQSFLETLAVMSEFFVALFVAAPLFLIVILVVMSLLGADTIAQLSLIVYALLPLGVAAFLVLLDTLSEPYTQPRVQFEERKTGIESGTALLAAVVRDAVPGLESPPVLANGDPELEAQSTAYLKRQRRRAVVVRLRDPLAGIRTQPVYSLLISAPLGVLALWVAVVVGLAEPTMAAMSAAPIGTTTWLVAVPLLVTITPWSYFHERKRARERHFARRFPDTLSVLASANKMGIQVVDALGLVSRWSSGAMATEMQTVRNDLRWNFDTRRALRGLANRVGVPQLSRTMTLISEGLRSSTDVSAVLNIAARDTQERFKLDRERRRELSPYLAVVIIGFLVFLLVVLLLDSAYLGPIGEAQQGAESPESGGSLPLSLTNVPVEAYRTLFFHAALIQALGSGLLAGKLAEGDTVAGLKYSIGLIIIAIVAFALI